VAEEIIPSESELDILKVLWKLGSASVRAVHEELCPGGELAFNTIQTLLRIMEEKGLVRHRAEG
jgi:predicted transcriptional regulator